MLKNIRKKLDNKNLKTNRKERKKGISLIALVITIIVIIILAAITFFASTGTVEKANYAKFTTNVSEVQSAIRQKALTLKGDEASKGKQLTDGQIYNYVAKGGKTDSDYVTENKLTGYTIIEDSADIGIDLPTMRVNTEEKTGVKIVYAVTDDGEVFIWPPYGYEEGYYITDSSTVTKDKIIKSGDSEVVIAKKPMTITTDKDGNLINRIPSNGDDSGNDKPVTKIKLTKPSVTGNYTYNGGTQTVKLSVFDTNTMTITGNTRKDAGSQEVMVSLKDTSKYEWADGTTSAVVLNWTIAKKSVSVTWSNLNFEYDGKNHIPTASVSGIYEGDSVTLNVTGAASTEGEHTATATFTGSSAENYELTNTTTQFTIVITTIDVSTLTITLSGTSFTYTGTEIKPTVTIKNGATTLSAGTDYTLSYSSNINAGTATITIKGNGKYIGTTTKNFTIERAKTATASASNKTYIGSSQTGVTGTNVDLSGTTSATNVGTYTATATPKANYAWSDGTTTAKTLTWKITAKASSSLTVTLATTTYTYDGTAKEPAVTVKDGSTTLTAGTHYTVSYSNNTNVGTATVTITMKGNYSGTITRNFTIERAKTATATASNKTYNGSSQTGVTGTNVDLSGTTSATNVGTYTAMATPKANYAWSDGTTTAKTLTWKITEKASSSLTVTLATTTYTYDGTAKEPAVTVKDGSTTLTAGTNYTAAYSNNINVGTATVTITMKGNYSGTITKNFTIERAKTASATASDKTYNGSSQTGVTGTNVDLSGTTSATNVGTYTATATPKANYAWSDGTTAAKTLTWKITEKASSSLTVTLATTTYTYDGTAKEPVVTVKDGSTTLTAGTHYTVSYSNNTNAGTATVTITMKGNYSGTITKNFTIERAKTATATASNKTYNGSAQTGVTGTNVDLSGTTSATNVGTYTATATPKANYAWSDGTTTAKTLTWKITAKASSSLTVTLATTTYTYDGTAKEPAVTVKDGSTTLTAGTNYTVAYSNNINVGTATATITMKGNYSGTITKNFTIERAKTASAIASDKTYNGSSQTGVTGTNVDLSGTTSATNVGTYTATATPKANYAWSDGTTTAKTLTWKITAKASSSLTVTLEKETYTYDGTAKEPAVTVKDGSTTLTLNTHYTLAYSNNTNAGTATVTITMKGNYSGTITKNFTIERAKTATASASDKTYNGSSQTGVTGTNVDLSGTISATNVGTYTATATPKANYAWSDGTTTAKTLTWKITAKASSSLTVTLATTTYTYDGTAKEPAVTVKDGNTTLTLNMHYTVAYSNNTNAGTATVTITMKGNYSGTVTKNFTIERAKTATASASDKTYNGSGQTGVTGTNVDLSGTTSATNVGTYTATATPKANYAWSDGTVTAKTLTWDMDKKQVSAEWGSEIVFIYDGKEHAPTATIPTGVTGETINVSVTGKQINASDTAYVATVVAESVTGGNAKVDNYEVIGTTKEYTISKREVIVVWSDTEIEYTGEILSPTATADSKVEGETITLAVTGEETLPGTYKATASIAEVVGGQAKASNYNLTNTSTEFEITKHLQVGDYVNHVPTSATYSTDSTKTGYDSQTLTTANNMKWRILSIDDTTGEVIITTDGLVHEKGITLKGATGYLYGAEELNAIAKKLYSSSNKGIYARSMTIEDLNKACGYVPSTDLIRYAWYPSDTADSDLKDIVAGGHTYTAKKHTASLVGGVDYPRFYNWDDKNGVTHQSTSETDYIELKSKDEPVLVTMTMYWYNPSSANATIGDILKGDDTNRGWLASPYVSLNSEYAYANCGLRTAYATYVYAYASVDSAGYVDKPSWGLHPVISINKKFIEYEDTSKNGLTADTAWELMPLEIGDYVDYTPEDAVYTTNSNITGTDSQLLSTDMTKGWRVLSIDWHTGDILATTDGIVNEKEITLKGTAGYFNGVSEINKIVNDLYSSYEYGIRARSMTIEDLDKACGYTPDDDKLLRFAWYPSNTSDSDLKNVVVNGKTYIARKHSKYLANGISYPRFYNWDDKNGVTHQSTNETDYIELKSKDEPILITGTSYWYSPAEWNSIVSDVLKGTQENRTWLASKYVTVDPNEDAVAYYGIECAYATGNYKYSSRVSTCNDNSPSAGLHPVISLPFNRLALDSNEQDGSTQEKAWKIIGIGVEGAEMPNETIKLKINLPSKYTVISKQWYTNTTNNTTNGTAITGATSDSILLDSSYAFKYIYVVVTAMKSDGTVEQFTAITDKASNAVPTIILKDYDYDYTGSPIEPAVTVKWNEKTLKQNKDYTVEYSNNTNEGKGTVTVTLKGRFSGVLTEQFNISLGYEWGL